MTQKRAFCRPGDAPNVSDESFSQDSTSSDQMERRILHAQFIVPRSSFIIQNSPFIPHASSLT
jgi:hypothetical protein